MPNRGSLYRRVDVGVASSWDARRPGVRRASRGTPASRVVSRRYHLPEFIESFTRLQSGCEASFRNPWRSGNCSISEESTADITCADLFAHYFPLADQTGSKECGASPF